ncbi:MAG: membrane protease YdiL (CAAX protease family) [Candidatus Krumholzibacteriia bacterium]|jgi:membrane protease YdiL (CAAX protease family)
MTEVAKSTQRPAIPSLALVAFISLTFAISWGLIGIFIFLPEWASTTFGEISGSHPFFFLATWAPAISAFALVIYFAGLSGLKAFLGRLFLWRCSLGWAAFILVGIPLVYVAGSLLKGGPVLAPFPPEGFGAMVAVLFMMLFLGPIEEFGWRGIAQPILQRHLAPIWAGALIGTVWGIWHLPAFFLSGTVFGGWNFLPFFIGNVTIAVLFTPIYNRAQGSLLWPMLFHWQLISPLWPDAQPYDTWILVALAVVVVWANRDTMFTRASGNVTAVIPCKKREEP